MHHYQDGAPLSESRNHPSQLNSGVRLLFLQPSESYAWHSGRFLRYAWQPSSRGPKPIASFCWSPLVSELPPLRSRCLQASFAAVEACFELPLANGGKFPEASGSGKLGTPCERMQREKASAVVVDAAGLVEEPPHAAASKVTPAVAMIASRFTLPMVARRDNSRRRRR